MDILEKKGSFKGESSIVNVKITYEAEVKELVLKTLNQLDKDYVIVQVCEVDGEMQPLHDEIKNRKIYCFYPVENSSLTKEYQKWIHYSSTCPSSTNCDQDIINTQIQIEESRKRKYMKKEEHHEEEKVKELMRLTSQKLQMDFQWIGLCYRLGTDIQPLCQQIQKTQNFKTQYISLTDRFLENLNEKLQNFKEGNILQIFSDSESEACQSLKEIEKAIEETICMDYNKRIILNNITNHSYLKLLKSRNYFQLLGVEESLKKRFKHFQGQAQEKYYHIYTWLTLENFIQLDQYWYVRAIQNAFKEANFTINKILNSNNKSYHEIVEENRKNIFKPFRPDFDSYFISICRVLKERAGCIKEAVGAIIVRNKRIIATGYNGTPMGSANCFNGGCMKCNDSQKMNTQILSCNCLHAEYGCILEAGFHVTEGCTLYSTRLPCLWCTKVIIQAKIKIVVYLKSISKSLEYPNQEKTKKIYEEAEIQLKQFPHNDVCFSKE